MFEIFLVNTSVPSTCMSKVLCSITYRYWLTLHLKSGDPGFLVVLPIFVADFEAFLVIGETRSKQHQICRKNLNIRRVLEIDLKINKMTN